MRTPIAILAAPLLAGIVAGAGACISASSPEYVRPTENVVAEGSEGEPAAEYELSTAAGDVGTARVWSYGVYKGRVNGAEKTVIRVGLQVENTSNQPILFDSSSTKITNLKANRRKIEYLPVSHLQGARLVQPGESKQLDLYFILPAGVQPQNVDRFTFYWSVSANGSRFSKFTQFVEDESYSYYYDRPFYGPYPYAYDPFYDPLYYDSFHWNYHRPVYVAPPLREQREGRIRGTPETRTRRESLTPAPTTRMREPSVPPSPPRAPSNPSTMERHVPPPPQHNPPPAPPMSAPPAPPMPAPPAPPAPPYH